MLIDTVARARLAILASLLAVLCPAAARAQTSAGARPTDVSGLSLDQLMNLPVTSVTLTSEAAGTAPARVRVITAEQIARRGYRSLADVLRDLPDVLVDLGGDQNFPAEYTVQGTRGSSRIVVLLDGIRISSPTGEPLPILSNYPVHAARQIEIVYGPSSAIYGADAFSLVVNLVTREPRGTAPSASVSSSIGRYGLTNDTGSFSTSLKGASLFVAGQVLYDAGPDLTKAYPDAFVRQSASTGVFQSIFGPMSPSRPVSPGYSAPVAAHSVQATLDLHGLRLVFFHNRLRTSTSPAYTAENAVYNSDVFFDNRLFVGAASYARQVGRVSSTSTLTLSRQELMPDSGYQNVYSNFDRSYKYAYGSMIKADQQLTWTPRDGLAVTVGGTYEHFFSIPQGADLNAPIRSRDQPGTILGTTIVDAFNDVRYANAGAYAQLQYTLSSKVLVTLGARGDRNTRFGATFNPRVGVVLTPFAPTTIKVMAGSAYLAPSPFEAYGHYGSFYSTDGGQTYASPYWHVPNPRLLPQHKRSVETEVRQKLTPDLSLTGSAFYARFSDLTQESDPTLAGPGTYLGWPVDYIDFAVNDGEQTTYGGAIGADFMHGLPHRGRIAVRASAAFADGTTWTQTPPVRLPIGAMAPVQWRAGVDLDWGAWSVAPRLTAAGRQRVMATTVDADGAEVRRTIAGYTTVDLNVVRQNVGRNVGMFCSIDNLFDRRYREINARAYDRPEELIGAPQNPRRLTVGLTWAFR